MDGMKEYTNNGRVEVKYDPESIATQQARYIMDVLVEQWATKFLEKNRKYREVDNSLGAKGVFPDVWRKVGILKSRMWLGHGVVGEATREVIQDLIGHLFLMLHMLDHESEQDADAAEFDLAQGRMWALDRAADRMARDGKSATEALMPIPLPSADSITAQWDRDQEWTGPQFDPTRPVRDQLVAAWEDGYEHGDRHEGENPYKHVYNSLMNCTRCGYAHVGADDRMYATPCLPRVSAEPSRPEMTVSERMERDGGRH